MIQAVASEKPIWAARSATVDLSSMLVRPESLTASIPCQTEDGTETLATSSGRTSAKPYSISSLRNDAAFSSTVSPFTKISIPRSILAFLITMSM